MSGTVDDPQGETATLVRERRSGPFTALWHRDFRLLLTGEFVSTLGRQMQTVIVTYQVYQFHHSALELGLLGLFRLIPVLIFSLAGGLFADRVDRRRLLLVTQPALLCCTLALILTTITGWASVGMIYGISAIAGMLSTVDGPAWQSILPALVPRTHLANALSWNITIGEVGTITGPAIGGLALGAFGIAGAYGCGVLSFVIVIGAVFAMRARLGAASVGASGGWRAAFEGLRFVRGNGIVAAIMSLDFFATFWGSATVLLPLYADKILHVGPTGLGILFSAPAVGSVLGAVAMTAVSHHIRKPGWPLLCAVAAYGLATVAFGLSRTLPLALLFLAGTGMADTISMTFRHQIMQLLTPNELRGRVTAAHQLFAGGGPQAGQLEAGVVAARFGTPVSIVSGGVACILTVAVIAWLVPAIRRYHAED